MAKQYLDKDGLLYFWQKIKSLFVSDVTYDSSSKKIQKTKNGSASDVVTLSAVATSGQFTDLQSIPGMATQYDNGFMSSTDKTKLDGIASGAEVNVQSDWNQTTTTADDYIKNKPTIPTLKNVFGKVKVGNTTIEADTTQDTLELVAGSNVTLTPDATDDKVTIAATDTTYSEATTSAAGLMSSSDKTKLNGIASGAEVNQNAFSNVKVGSTTVAADAKTDTLELVAGSNITLTPDATDDKVTIAATDTTYSEATTSTAGLMSSSDKTKLNGIATGAEVNQNAFSNVKVGSTTVAADGKTDTLELEAGSNITLTPDATNDKVTIAATDTTYSDFTAATAGDAGAHGLVPAPAAGEQGYILFGGALDNSNWQQIELEFAVRANGATAIDVSRKHGTAHSSLASVTIPKVGTNNAGLMIASDKTKLDKLVFDGSNKIDSSILPSYVDDVIESYPVSGTTELSAGWLSASSGGSAFTPETGKIYVLMAASTNYDSNTQFRWGGTAYVKLADGGVSSITNAEIDTIVAS